MESIKNYVHGGNIYKAAKELNLKSHRILDFSANINSLGLSPKGKRSLKKNIKSITNYPDPDYVNLNGIISQFTSIDEDNIFLGNGAIELLYQYANFKRGCRALIPAPGFVEYEKALSLNSLKIDYYKNKNELRIKDYDIVFLCNPNNPTGESYSESFLLKLLMEGEENNVDIFVDEAFIDYSSYPSMKKYINEFNNLFILRSLTKFFAIPGLRFGFLLTSNKSFKIFYKNNNIPWSINGLVESYIQSAINDKKYINNSLKYLKKERVRLYKKLSRFNDLKVYRSQGNYLLFKLLKNINLYDLLKKDGILIRSCSNYNNLDESFYRVAVKKRNQNKKLIKSIQKYIK